MPRTKKIRREICEYQINCKVSRVINLDNTEITKSGTVISNDGNSITIKWDDNSQNKWCDSNLKDLIILQSPTNLSAPIVIEFPSFEITVPLFVISLLSRLITLETLQLI